MRKIELTQGKYALVDNEDFEKLNQYKWYAAKAKKNVFYAVRHTKKQKNIRMHCLIMDTPKYMDTDHKDGNGLNNQKKNLRICTKSQNAMNRSKRIDNTSGFKGVSFHSIHKKWQARIMINGKAIGLGYYLLEIDAYKVYCKACVKYHGEFSRKN